MAEGPDGRWTSIVHPDIYRAVRTAGEVFQAVLRDELTDRLGVVWCAGRHVPEIAGVPQGLLDVFSKRSKEIEDWLADTGTIGNRAGRQRAVLATRRAKPEVEDQRFDAAWKIEAEAFGWGPDAAERLLVSLEPSTRLGTDVDDEWIVDVLRSLTDHDATFDRNDLVRAVAARLSDGAPRRQIERTVAAVLDSDHLMPVADAWTSAELMNVERRFLNAATTRRGMRYAVNPAVISRLLAAFPTLGADQRTAVEQLAGSPDGVMVLVGPAGTGKTSTLDAVRSVYENAGYRVIGAAPSAKAAHELQHGAHIASATIHRHLASWRHGYDRPGLDTLLVVDEAEMAGTRDLEAIVSATVAAGGRVLLAGDHHQLPEVTAGGGFAALVAGRMVTTVTLTSYRRQTEPWERDALNELRDGHVATAVEMVRHDSALLLLDEEPADIDLVHVLNQRRSKSFALTIEANADLIGRLATGLDRITLETYAASARRAEQLVETITGVTPAQVRPTVDRSFHTASHLSVGCRVKPVDRNNVGTVSSIDDRAGAAVVQFVSEDGRHAERRFGWDEIAVLERHPQSRLLNRDAQAALDAIVAGHHDSIDRWNQVMARESFTPDDPHIYGAAARTHTDRAAARLTATHPEWLHVALGDRPKAPADAQVWDDAVRDVAAIVARRDGSSRAVDYHGQPLAPTGPYRPEQAVERLAVARAWLDQQAEITPVVLRHRTPEELIERRTELDAIMSTAPADTRLVVEALAANQLPLDGILDAVDAGSRRRWILEHWPHVVEAAQVNSAIPDAPVAAVGRDESHGIEFDLDF